MESIVLAFDIERSGPSNKYDTIAIGASVVDSTGKQLDSFIWLGFTEETTFEARCWNEFWSKNKEILESLKYTGPLNKKENEKKGIIEFQKFRAKWENRCCEDNVKLMLTSDNVIYDGGFINQLIFEYMPDTLPIPYSAGKQKYSDILDVSDFVRGIINISDTKFALENKRGFMKRLRENYAHCELSNRKKDIKHDHNPANDAYNIACDLQLAYLIMNNNVKII